MANAGGPPDGGLRRIGPPSHQPPPSEPPAAGPTDPVPRGRAVAFAIFGLTVMQLAMAVIAPSVPQFNGRAFTLRLYLYPVLMMLPPLLWWVARRRSGSKAHLPWAGFAFLMTPFCLDVSANALDLYRSVAWWHGVAAVVYWFLLGIGIGLLLRQAPIRQPWILGMAVTGIGAIAAITWQVGRWVALIQNEEPATTASVQVLVDESMATIGAALAGALFWAWQVRRRRLRRVAAQEQGGSKPTHLRVVR